MKKIINTDTNTGRKRRYVTFLDDKIGQWIESEAEQLGTDPSTCIRMHLIKAYNKDSE